MHKRRPGYTLFELMLVLAVLIVVGALSVPVVESMLSTPRVTAGRDMVRARLADIRGRAMQEGRPYKFCFMEKSGKFRLEPEDSDTSDGSGALIFEGELPEKLMDWVRIRLRTCGIMI